MYTVALNTVYMFHNSILMVITKYSSSLRMFINMYVIWLYRIYRGLISPLTNHPSPSSSIFTHTPHRAIYIYSQK